MTEPDDRELERYLDGGSKLSARYREAGGESTPPELDEVILAQARAEARRKPNVNRYLAPVALAASLVLAVNLAWNLYRVEPLHEPAPVLAERLPGAPADAAAPVAAPPPPPAAPAPEAEARLKKAAPAAEEQERREAATVATQPKAEPYAAGEPHALAEREVQAANRARLQAQETARASAAAGASADAAPLTESRKIDLLIGHVGRLQGAAFIRNGKEYGPAEAAKHLQFKRAKAGDRVETAGDFIRLCASFSTVSGDAYLIRFADGRTRTAEDVLREELARIEGVR